MLIATPEAGRVVKEPLKPVMDTTPANFRRNNALLIPERVASGVEGNWYVRVLLSDDNTYQLECRDGVAAEHYHTRTISQKKVLTEMLGWAAGRGTGGTLAREQRRLAVRKRRGSATRMIRLPIR
ncbi:hypothetical protein [Streptomyces sp. NPDC055094]